MTIKTGDKLPDAKFSVLGADGMKQFTTADIFAGKKVVLFAVPGAFTPTCSAKHLPGFVEQAASLGAKGVDTIACLSVNDAFVMNAWSKAQSADGVLMLADGNATFTKALGLELDGTGFGMGIRSQRFALIAKDGVVEQLFIDAPGAFELSSAEHVLKHL